MRWTPWHAGLPLALALFLALCGSTANAQDTKAEKKRTFAAAVKKVETAVTPETARRGETVVWRLTIELEKGWHTYPTRQSDPAEPVQDQVTEIQLENLEGLIPVGQFRDPPGAHSMAKPKLKIKKLLYYEDRVVWEQRFVVDPRSKPGTREIKARVTVFVCDEVSCLAPKTVERTATLKVSDEPPVQVEAQYKEAVEKALASKDTPRTLTPKAPPASDSPDELDGSDDPQSSGLLAFILQG